RNQSAPPRTRHRAAPLAGGRWPLRERCRRRRPPRRCGSHPGRPPWPTPRRGRPGRWPGSRLGPPIGGAPPPAAPPLGPPPRPSPPGGLTATPRLCPPASRLPIPPTPTPARRVWLDGGTACVILPPTDASQRPLATDHAAIHLQRTPGHRQTDERDLPRRRGC